MLRERLRVLLADDHLVVSAGIGSLLEPTYEIAGLAQNGLELLRSAEETQPDIVITDVSMPLLDGLEATRQLKRKMPQVRVIILTVHADAGHVQAAFAAGAAGYLVKSSAPLEIFEAIEKVLAGGRYVTPAIAEEVIDSLLLVEPEDQQPLLTQREAELATLIGLGLENSEIADNLCIAEVTVRTHFLNILRKLGLKNRVQLARYALCRGLATLEEAPRPAAQLNT